MAKAKKTRITPAQKQGLALKKAINKHLDHMYRKNTDPEEIEDRLREEAFITNCVNELREEDGFTQDDFTDDQIIDLVTFQLYTIQELERNAPPIETFEAAPQYAIYERLSKMVSENNRGKSFIFDSPELSVQVASKLITTLDDVVSKNAKKYFPKLNQPSHSVQNSEVITNLPYGLDQSH